MNSLLYHDPYHHFHDPTIINVHTLLNPQPYQHPSYINTQSSPFTSYTPLYQQPHKIPISNPPSTLPPSYYTSPSLAPSSLPNPYFPPSNHHQQPKSSYSSFPIPSTLANSYPLSATSFHPHGYGYSAQPMVISVFDGDEDAYSWLLRTEKIFKEQVTPEAVKVTKAVAALRDRALKWWLWRSRRQPPTTTWDAFTAVFLWRFKPEWREIWPVDNEEKEPDLDLSLFNGSNSHVVTESTTTITNPEFSNFKNHNATLSAMDDYFAVETGEEFGEFIASEESSVTTQQKEEEATPILKTTVATEIIEESVFTISKPHEKSTNVTMRLVPNLMCCSYPVFAKCFSTSPASLQEKMVPHIVVVTTPHPRQSFIFDPGGAESLPAIAAKHDLVKFLAVKRRKHLWTISFPVEGVVVGAASGRPWVPWSRKHIIRRAFTVVFDPGGDEHRFRSPMSIFGNFNSTSSLQVPWDRGKLSVFKPLFTASVKHVFFKCLFLFTPVGSIRPSAIVSFPARGAASGWPWVPWSSMKITGSPPVLQNTQGKRIHQG